MPPWPAVNNRDRMSAGGSQVAPEVIRSVGDAFGCAVAVIYGQTEYCPVILLIWAAEGPKTRQFLGVGRNT